MPIYEYQCQSCGHELEKLQKISDEPLTLCPACNKSDLKKKVSAAGFRLKGAGWYETDFKTKGKKNLHGDKGGSGASEKKSTDTAKSDSKKPDSKPSSAASSG